MDILGITIYHTARLFFLSHNHLWLFVYVHLSIHRLHKSVVAYPSRLTTPEAGLLRSVATKEKNFTASKDIVSLWTSFIQSHLKKTCPEKGVLAFWKINFVARENLCRSRRFFLNCHWKFAFSKWKIVLWGKNFDSGTSRSSIFTWKNSIFMLRKCWLDVKNFHVLASNTFYSARGKLVLFAVEYTFLGPHFEILICWYNRNFSCANKQTNSRSVNSLQQKFQLVIPVKHL